MSTVTVATQRVGDDDRSLPLRPMLRVTWLQHRLMILTSLGLVAALALYMFATGPAIHSMYAQWVTSGCPLNKTNELVCMDLQARMLHSAINVTFIDIALHVLPVVLGMFLGAPLIAREFESGTYRFTWTQGMPRALWFALKFAFLAIIIIVATSLLGALATSYSAPFNGVGLLSRWLPGEFDLTGLTLGAWSFLAFALGVLLGSITKRVVSAMAVTGVVAGCFLIAVFWKLDERMFDLGAKVMRTLPFGSGYGPLNQPSERSFHAPAGSWLLRGWYEGPKGNVLSTLAEKTLTLNPGFENAKSHGAWLALHHYSYWLSYQPSSRCGLFQIATTVVLVILALLFAWGASLLIRRRA